MGPETRIRSVLSSATRSRHAGERRKLAHGTSPGEDEFDLVVGEVAQGLDPADPGQPAIADDRHAVARPLDLGEDVARQKIVRPSAFASRMTA